MNGDGGREKAIPRRRGPCERASSGTGLELDGRNSCHGTRQGGQGAHALAEALARFCAGLSMHKAHTTIVATDDASGGPDGRARAQAVCGYVLWLQ